MLCVAGFSAVPIVCVIYALTLDSFTDGYKQGKQDGYKAGYVMSLVNQKKGVAHDFVLAEQGNGEFVWVEAKGDK
jgi:hypothetical protein